MNYVKGKINIGYSCSENGINSSFIEQEQKNYAKINIISNLPILSQQSAMPELDIPAASIQTSEQRLNYDSRQSTKAVEENLVQFYHHVWWTPVLVR